MSWENLATSARTYLGAWRVGVTMDYRNAHAKLMMHVHPDKNPLWCSDLCNRVTDQVIRDRQEIEIGLRLVDILNDVSLDDEGKKSKIALHTAYWEMESNLCSLYIGSQVDCESHTK